MARLYTKTSESQEYRLAQTLIWSKTDFNLAEFVEQFELPQVVFVEVGYDGGDERTTFSSGQILTLHTVRTVSKIVCQVPPNNAVLVPKDCPLKAEVIPMSCHDTVVTAYKLSTIYRKVKYVRVMEIGSTSWDNNSLDSTKIDDILQIKKVSTSDSVIRCKNLTTEEDVSILIDSTAVFVPLVDSNTYTLAEIQKKFGLPAKIRFLDKDAERKLHSAPKVRRPFSKTSPYLSDMGQIKAIEEMQDSDVIVTTVCSNLENKVCLPVPTTLDIRVTVAEGFLKGDETYQKVVKTLDKQFKRTDLKDFSDLDIYQHMDAVKKELQDTVTVSTTIEEASSEIRERARESAQRIAQKKRIMSFSIAAKPPKIVPRGQKSAEEKKPPPRPPKLGKKPESKPKKTGKIMMGIKTKSKHLVNSLEHKHSSSKSTSSEETYEEAIEQDGIYSHADETFYERSEDDCSSSSSEYQELDVNYETVPRSYEKLVPAPNMQIKQINRSTIQSLPLPPTPSETIIPSPPLPTTSPPQTEDRNAIYEAISRYPQDLSGLTVADVSKLLRYLGMKDYVETFANELIDGEMLTTLDQNSLQSLNVQSFHCNKLLRFIGGWRPNV